MAYIYEYIRTRGFEPLYLEEHFARLDALSRRLFLTPLNTTREVLCREIANALLQSGASPRTMNAVCVRYSNDGEIGVDVEELLYNSFSLRALRPRGYLCRVSGDLILENNSAKESLVELNRAMAQISDEGVAVWCDEQGEVLAIDGSSVIAVFEDEIRFSRRGSGVEFDVAYAVSAGIKPLVSSGVIMVDDLRVAKEILCVDHRGVTALHSFNSHRYMDLIGEKIAARVAEKDQ